jgi:diguanylate cyclase (GGDEF)-like protein
VTANAEQTSSAPASHVPYRILAILLFASGAISALFALFPTAGQTLRNVDFAVAAVLIGLGAFAVLVAPRISAGWGLDALIALVIVIGAVGAATVPTAEAQVVVGFGLTLFAVFAGYFRPRSRFLVLLALAVAGFAAGAAANPVLSTPVVAIVIVAAMSGVSIMVNVQSMRMHELVLHDPLTGVLNRRGLDFHAPQLAAAAARSRSPVTVGLIDLDDFKAFNDARGHAAGDDLLVAVSRVWRRTLRRSDLVVRYGGDEFAVVMVGMGIPDAERTAARVAATQPQVWSIGFSEWQPDEDVYDALARADAAMFKAKP